ncbi:MAG: MFS transporter [bacterium]
MYKLLLKSKKVNTLTYIYLATFFLAFHYYLTTYINSSFLKQYANTYTIGLIYATSSIVSIILFLYSSKFLERFGSYYTMLWVAGLDVVFLTSLIASHNSFWVILFFIAHSSINPLILLNLDNFLESSSENAGTGRIRGIFLTLMNMTAVMSPIIVGSILTEGSFSSIYILSILTLLPLIYIVARRFKNLKDNNYHHIHLENSVRTFIENKDIRNIYISNLLLQIFYSWVVIYVPIYLHETLGFDWQQLGLMISIALLPFVTLEIPIGTLADKKFGEKEILILGFIVTAIGLCIMTFVHGNNFILWTIILLIARMGASLIEITTESYFFKQINSANQNLISTFRTAGPMGYILGPLLGSILLIFIDQRYTFLILGGIMLSGIAVALRIKDTK